MNHDGNMQNMKVPAQMLLRLQAVSGSLKRAERSAAELLMARPEFVAQSSIAAVAEEVGVSQPTFIRLAKRLGYSGYAEMKEVLMSGMREPSSAPEMPYAHIDESSSAHEIAQSIVRASIQALNDLLFMINPEDYERAASALLKAERIAFFGSGDSGLVASSAFQKFMRTGAVCHTATDGDTQLMLCSLMNERCVCVLISHSGDTESVVHAAKLAKAAGATTIAVTNFPYSHLAKLCDIVLLTATFVECGGEVVTKRITQHAIIESLYIIYRLRGGKSCKEALAITDRVVAEANKL